MQPATYYDARQASAYLIAQHGIKVAAATLAKYRVTGDGPAFQKFGHQVRYTPAALDRWVAGKLSAPVTSTSELGQAAERRSLAP